jgi:hypothetical protein
VKQFMRKGYLLLAIFLLVIPGISQGATIYSGSLTDAYSGTYTLEVTDGDPGANTYSATLTVDTNVVSNAYIDWFAVHFDTPAAVITGVITAPTGTWTVGDGVQTVYGYAGGNQGFPTGNAFTGGFEAGITNDGSIDETGGFLLNGGIYAWSFDFTSTAPILGEEGGDPNLQVGFYGSGVTGFRRLSETFHVPEASALLLLGTGLVGLVAWRRKKRFE